MLIRARDSVLIVIDMQERLVPAMVSPARTIKNANRLVVAAKELSIPVLLTEQYPRGLGRTVPELAKTADTAQVIEKTHFSCLEEPEFASAFEATGRRQAVIAGMEAHICVVQTASSLLDARHEVFVVTDATASRSTESEQACIHRLSANGAGIVTTEMVIFEWLGKANTDAFRRLLPLVK